MGSILQLTDMYSNNIDGDAAGGPGAFELRLNSPADIQLLRLPPWWTLRRALAIVAVLSGVLGIAFVWITLLRRQVDERTAQLKREISERQRAEQDRAIEQERSRIAQDLHDDLGSSLTAINMLAMTGSRSKLNPDASRARLQQIEDRSRSMVTALDALVWAVNPKNDTLAAMAEYLASFAEEFLAKTEIACRIEQPLDFPKRALAADVRHNVLLAVKEILSNAIRHGRPNEILLQFLLPPGKFEITIHDNGGGFDPARNVPGDGLANIQERMRHINGRCRIESSPGNGTTVSLTLPL
jgi:signal transduction histidine kinase